MALAWDGMRTWGAPFTTVRNKCKVREKNNKKNLPTWRNGLRRLSATHWIVLMLHAHAAANVWRLDILDPPGFCFSLADSSHRQVQVLAFTLKYIVCPFPPIYPAVLQLFPAVCCWICNGKITYIYLLDTPVTVLPFTIKIACFFPYNDAIVLYVSEP